MVMWASISRTNVKVKGRKRYEVLVWSSNSIREPKNPILMVMQKKKTRQIQAPFFDELCRFYCLDGDILDLFSFHPISNDARAQSTRRKTPVAHDCKIIIPLSSLTHSWS
jgi:hypothetical protein